MSVTAQVTNSGRSVINVSWSLPGSPFGASTLPAAFAPGSTPIHLTVNPTDAGTFTDALTATWNGQRTTLPLSFTAKAIPACPTPVTCYEESFDLSVESCIDRPLPDGTGCDPHNVCVTNPKCQAGRCVGDARVCNDQNACTLDICDAQLGCQFIPAAACPGDGKCQVGYCDPASGCQLALAADGTVCGPSDCGLALICLSGVCQTRVPPDGFLCAPASPCQGEGRCSGGQCLRSAALPLVQTWWLDTGDAGVAPNSDFVMEPGGAMTLVGYNDPEAIRVNTPDAGLGTDTSRRCILWNGQLTCADFEVGNGEGEVGQVDLATAVPSWTFYLPGVRPDFAALEQPGNLFMARVAALGSDRLAALFEGYPADGGAAPRGRDYFLVLLDVAGNMVAAERVQHPMLEVQAHPHPFGVVSDVQGRLFMAFAFTQSTVPPLRPESPTLTMAFDHDGTLMWSREDDYVGGELATAHGLVFPQRGAVAYVAADGTAVPFDGDAGVEPGRAVATVDHVLGSPANGVMNGVTLPGLLPAWTYVPSGGNAFASDQVRLADWTSPSLPATTTVALVVTQPGSGSPLLTAVSPQTGAELWTCPLGSAADGGVQLFEVGQNTLGTMEHATTCGACDPPFALSHSLFRSFSVPGIAPASAPWSGEFGSGTHDHHERPALLPGAN